MRLGDVSPNAPRRGRIAPIESIVPTNDVAAVNARLRSFTDSRLSLRELGRVGEYPVLVATFRGSESPKTRVLLTGGVHGNEPASAGAAVLFIERLLRETESVADLEVVVVPALNPIGLTADTRRNADDLDLNRQALPCSKLPQELQLLTEVLDSPYDLGLDLHTGVVRRTGFWVLHNGGEDFVGAPVSRFGQRWPLLWNQDTPYDMTSPGIGTSTRVGTLKDFFVFHGTPIGITVEAPGSLDYASQVLGLADLAAELVDEARERVG
ncbi:MAG: DUF2817 domain-containing protein [Myxococcota bacterium]